MSSRANSKNSHWRKIELNLSTPLAQAVRGRKLRAIRNKYFMVSITVGSNQNESEVEGQEKKTLKKQICYLKI
jgi:hypothetical protein